ncbi:MAG: exonuclease SbcCD subunit D [Oscillospiraceae bacterium]|nr:exonuclease SbcCD subunit D [Oscillospiraceae bacterium]
MKILHTSDLHLGISLCGIPLLPYQKKFCDTLCKAAENADAVIIAGDIFDTSVASAEAVRCWSELATKLCTERKIPVIVCAGNHDGAARLASCADLLKSAGLYISGAFEDAFTPVIIGNTAIYSMPYFNPTDAAAVLGCKPTAAEVMKSAAKKILQTADPDKCNILAAHCFAAGAVSGESDISARASEAVGGADRIPLSAFDGFNYVALGHLHKPQTLSRPESKTVVRYSGTPLPYSFGEAAYPKTLTIFDTETGSISETEVPLPYTLRTIEDTYENILAAAEKDEKRGDFMRITVTDRYVGDGLFMQMKELYPNLLRFSGRQYESSDGKTVSAKEAFEMDIVTLAKRYCAEHRGDEPDSDELKWLAEAMEDIEQNG